MKLTTVLSLLAVSLHINAAPTEGNLTPIVASYNNFEVNEDSAISKRSASRFSCGQYKFDDGTVQEFYGQVWAGIPADQMVCRHFKYEFHDKKGQEGKMVAAKVDSGCTCFFYGKPCNPSEGYAEQWKGWMDWENYAPTDKEFKGWYCFEQS